MSFGRVLNVVKAVDAYRRISEELSRHSYFGRYDLWKYEGVYDDVICEECLNNAVTTFFIGTHLRKKFRYLKIIDANTIEVWVHPNCLLPETLVRTSTGLVAIKDVQVGDWVLTHRGRFRPIIQLHRNKFHGELSGINGEWMTSNHPVLTLKGWMAPNCFNSLGENIFYLGSPNMESNENPSFVRQKSFLPLTKTLMLLRSMPISSINFDSEFCLRDSKVNVKDVNGVLGDNFDSSIFKRFEKQLFKRRHFALHLKGHCTQNLKFPCLLSPSNKIMSRFDLVRSLLRSHPLPFKPFSFAMPSVRDTSVNESTGYYPSADSISFSECIFGDSLFDIKSNNFVNGENTLPHYQTSTIKHIDKQQYKGYVHNLSVAEDESYTIGNRGLVVHNCRCLLHRVTTSWEYLMEIGPFLKG